MAFSTQVSSETTRWVGETLAEHQQMRTVRDVVADLLFEGKIPVNLPWGDREFQRCLLEGIARLRKCKADADKLAIIKEVFGGSR